MAYLNHNLPKSPLPLPTEYGFKFSFFNDWINCKGGSCKDGNAHYVTLSNQLFGRYFRFSWFKSVRFTLLLLCGSYLCRETTIKIVQIQFKKLYSLNPVYLLMNKTEQLDRYVRTGSVNIFGSGSINIKHIWIRVRKQ